jgi:hypothetical protein
MIQYSVKTIQPSQSDVNQSKQSNQSKQYNEIYDILVTYFNNPIFYKIRDVGNTTEKQTYSMYANKAYCLSLKECRYGIVFVKGDQYEIGHSIPLNELKWISFQLRTMTENLVDKVHGYNLYHYEPLTEARITRKEITDKASIYTCEKYPNIEIVLLHTKTKTKDSYQNSGNLASALATWETIINLV